jgi:hypothetical protein
MCKVECESVDYEIVADVEIDVFGRQYVFGATHLFDNRGQMEYWGYDKNENILYVFDLFKGMCTDSVVIASEGPTQIRGIFDFMVLSPDSILVHNNNLHHLYLIDRKAEIIDSWSFANTILPAIERSSDVFYLATFPNNGVTMKLDLESWRMYFFVLHYGFPKEKGSYPREQYEFPYIAVYDLHQRAFVEVYGDYPNAYKSDEQCSYDLYFPFFLDHALNTFVSFSKSHCIFKYNSEKHEEIICARSKYLPLNFDFLPYGEKVASRNEHWRTKGTYENMIHDPYHKRIYRIAVHAQPNKNAEDKLNQKSQAPWSIMALDERGRCLGEALFPASRYNFMEIFPLPDGLLISKENDFNPQNIEDTISFDLIQLKL